LTIHGAANAKAGGNKMKVYILISDQFEPEIDGVYLKKKDAIDMIDSCCKDYRFKIEEHEVIE
jgi:hypothetical protein